MLIQREMFFENPKSVPRRKLKSIDYYNPTEIIIHQALPTIETMELVVGYCVQWK